MTCPARERGKTQVQYMRSRPPMNHPGYIPPEPDDLPPPVSSVRTVVRGATPCMRASEADTPAPNAR
jgi:hypothetical protein